MPAEAGGASRALAGRQVVRPAWLGRSGASILVALAFVVGDASCALAAAEYQAKADLQATVALTLCAPGTGGCSPCAPTTVGCVPRAVVTATLISTRIPGHGTACATGRTSVFLSGPRPENGPQESGGDEQVFPITTSVVAEYALSGVPQEVQVLAEGQCDDAEYGFASPYVIARLPASYMVEHPGVSSPEEDPPWSERALPSTYSFRRIGQANTWPAVLACAAGRGSDWSYFAVPLCRYGGTAVLAANAVATSAGGPSSAPPLPATSFSPASFAASSLYPRQCRRFASSRKPHKAHRTDARTARRPKQQQLVERRACNALGTLGRSWLAALSEQAWLYRELAAQQEQTAPIGAALADPATTSGWVHRAVAVALVDRAAEVQGELAQLDRQLASALRGTQLDVRYPRSLATRALSAFRRGRTLAAATRAELSGAGVHANPALVSVTGSAPRRLSSLLEASASPVPMLEYSTLSAQGTSSALEAWLGSAANALASACEASYESDWARLRQYTAAYSSPPTYGFILARALLAHASVPFAGCKTTEPTFAPLAEPLGAVLSAAPSVLVPSLASSPTGLGNSTNIAIAPDGSLLINDELTASVKHYSQAGVLLGSIGEEGTGLGQFTQPADSTTDAEGHVYVSDYKAHHVLRFSPTGAYELTIGTQGEGLGQFEHPAGLAWSPFDGELVVVDAPNGPEAAHGRLEAFNTAGKPLWATPVSSGEEESHLSRPRGLAISANGTIAVADSNLENPRILLFSSTGALLGATPAGLGLVQPYGVAFDPAGNLWVADRGAGLLELSADLNTVVKRYSVFGPSGTLLAPSSVAFAGSQLLVLDFAGQQLLSIPASGV
jgi:hypothetical protein